MRLVLLILIVAASLPATTLTHSYNLTTSLADAVGSIDLSANGGSISAGTGYVFGADQGLLADGIVNASSYTIRTIFEFDAITGYRKIADLTNLAGAFATDPGLYNFEGNLQWYNSPGGTGAPIGAGQFADVVVTRGGVNNTVTGYVNGVQQFSFDDTTGIATFQNDPNQTVYFFEDDNHSAGREASSGTARLIQVWDGALTASEVADLPATGPSAAAPEPGAISLMLLGTGFAAFLRAKEYRRKPTA